LLTGGNGFLGRIIKDTIKSNCEIFTLGRINSNFCVDLSCCNEIKFIENFKLVIHLAGKAHEVSKRFSENQEFFDVNVKGTYNLLKGLESTIIPKQFVFVSTVAVYGVDSGILINENSPLLATEPYGQSKIQAEQLIQDWCIKHKVVCTILRLPLIVGPNPPGNLGVMIRGIKKGYYFNIDGGNAQKSMVLAKDVANHILKIAEVGGIYNLTDGYHPNFNELSQLVAKQLGVRKIFNIPYLLAKLVAIIGDLFGASAPLTSIKLKKITSDLTFNDSKARSAFGWNPTLVLKGFKIN